MATLTKRLRILGRVFTITRNVDEENAGLCDKANGTINISPSQDEFSRKDTELHEVMHAILHQQGFDHPYPLEERFVRPLATGVLTVLQDNPTWAKRLIERIK